MADLTVTPADVRPLPGAISFRFTAGGTVNVGDEVYIAADDDVEQTDASALATANGRGIVVSAPNGKLVAAAGDAVDVVVFGPVAGFDSLTPDTAGYASETAGKIADAAPTTASSAVWPVGYAQTAEVFFVLPGFVPAAQTAVADLTDNSGGAAADTLAALTNIDTLTDSTGGAADDTVDDVSTAVTGVDGSGSNAASKADVDTRLTAINANFTELTEQAITQQAYNDANTDAVASLSAKINAILAALRKNGALVN
jgi:hypothetical protein